MLISMHTSFLYEGMRGKLAELDQFLDQQQKKQQQWRRDLHLTKSEAEQAYAFMQWCDRLSLILCQRQLPADQRYLEISQGPDGKRYDVKQRSQDQSVEVKPWPFQASEFSVSVEAADLSQVKFSDDAELTQALRQAPIKTLTWQFIK